MFLTISNLWTRYAATWADVTHACYGRVVRSDVAFEAFALYRAVSAEELA